MPLVGLHLGIDTRFGPAEVLGRSFGSPARQRQALVAGPACTEPAHQQIDQATWLLIACAAFERCRADAEGIALDPRAVLLAAGFERMKIQILR